MKKVSLRALELLFLAVACFFLIPPYSSTEVPPNLLLGLAFATTAFLASMILAYRREAETLVTATIKLLGFVIFGWVIHLRCAGA